MLSSGFPPGGAWIRISFEDVVIGCLEVLVLLLDQEFDQITLVELVVLA